VAARPPYLFFKYLAHELRLSSSVLPLLPPPVSGGRVSGGLPSFNRWDDLDLASSPPNLLVNGVRAASPSSSSSSSFPKAQTAELLLRASLAFLSLSAAYLDLPLGY